MDFNEKKKKFSPAPQKVEKSLLNFMKEMLKENIGAKRKDVLNKGFFYYYTRNRSMFRYSLSHAMKDEEFSNVIADRKKLIKLIKSWSARFNRYMEGSIRAVDNFKKDSNHIISYPTLANQLSVSDLLILTEGMSDEEFINLLRPKR